MGIAASNSIRGLSGVLAGEPDPTKREALKRVYEQVPVPPELTGRLTGSPEQIAARHKYEAALSEALETEEDTCLWEVTLEGSATKAVYVRALDEKEARERAGDRENWEEEDDVDYDCDLVTDVRRVHGTD